MDDKDLLADFGKAGDLDTSADSTQKLQKISGGELEKFCRSVIDQLIKDNVPPVPENYKIYFVKTLHDQSTQTFRKKINEMMNFEDLEDSKQVFIEKTVKKAFTELSLLMQDIAMVYKNTAVMRDLLQKKVNELSTISSELTVKHILDDLKANMQRFDSLLKKYSHDIKIHFESILESCKIIDQKSDFDPVYEIYNKKFLLELIQKCKEGYAKYNYQNALVLISIKESTINEIEEKKERVVLKKNITKAIKKSIDSGDIIASYNNDVFAIVLKHTNIQNAQKKAQNLLDIAYNTTFFIEEKEVNLNLEMSMGMIKDTQDTDKFIASLVKALEKSGKDKENFIVLE